MDTAGNKNKVLYERFEGKRVYIKCTDDEPGKACDYLFAKVEKVDENGITISEPVDKFISFDKITEIGEQKYNAAL